MLRGLLHLVFACQVAACPLLCTVEGMLRPFVGEAAIKAAGQPSGECPCCRRGHDRTAPAAPDDSRRPSPGRDGGDCVCGGALVVLPVTVESPHLALTGLIAPATDGAPSGVLEPVFGAGEPPPPFFGRHLCALLCVYRC